MGVLGERTNISSFYISFVLAPLASNASELIAAFNYSLKKTSRTIVISFAALQVKQKRLFAWAWNRTAQSITCAIKPLWWQNGSRCRNKSTATNNVPALFSASQGAACMNNTFCLAVFMFLIFFRNLAWEFSAETVTILLVQVSRSADRRYDSASLEINYRVFLPFMNSLNAELPLSAVCWLWSFACRSMVPVCVGIVMLACC